MAIKIGDGSTLRSVSNGELVVTDEMNINGNSQLIITQGEVDSKPFGKSFGVFMTENPQADKSSSVVNPTPWQITNTVSRRIDAFKIQAAGASTITNAVLILIKWNPLKNEGGVVYKLKLPDMVVGVENEFSLLSQGNSPMFLKDLDNGVDDNYFIQIVKEEGYTGDIELASNIGGVPFYGWNYQEVVDEPLTYDSQIIPVVETTVKGINFGEALNLQAGGDDTFQSNRVIGEISALVTHEINSERATDRYINVAGRTDDFPAFTTNSATLTNPAFLFATASNIRLLDLQLQSAGAQTNVDLRISDNATGKIIWESCIPSIPASGTFKVDFTDTSFDRVPADIFDSVPLSISLSSEDGDVLVLGNSGTDQPWLTLSFYIFSDFEIAYLSDITGGFDGAEHLDSNTSVPVDKQDGSIFLPYATIDQAQTALGSATPSNQHTLSFRNGTYLAANIPLFTHYDSAGADSQSVIIPSVTFDSIGGDSSISNLRANMIIYDTSADIGSSSAALRIKNCDSNGGIQATGLGAGRDYFEMDNVRIIDSINPILDCHFRMQNCRPTTFANNINVAASGTALYLKNGYTSIFEIDNCDLISGGNLNVITLEAEGNSTLYCRITASRCPAIVTFVEAGSTIIIVHDAGSKPVSISDLGNPSVLQFLDESESIFYDNSTTTLTSNQVNAAITELALRDAGDSPIGDNVVHVRQESDFGTVVTGVRIDVFPDKTFILDSTVTQTLPFLLPTGSGMRIEASDRNGSRLSYINAVEPQFQGADIGDISLCNIIIEGDPTSIFGDIVGGSLSIRETNINGFDTLGTWEDLSDFFVSGSELSAFTRGFDLVNPNIGTVTTTLLFPLDFNTEPFFNVSGDSSGEFQIFSNVMSDNSNNQIMRISPDYPVGNHITVSGNNTDFANTLFNTEGTTGVFENVSDANISTTVISEVQDSGGVARFIHANVLEPHKYQEITIVGFVTNTEYNGTYIITDAGVGFFEVGVPFGTDEVTGSFSGTSVTMIDTGTTLVDGDVISIDTDFSIEYDGGATVYNKQPNSFQIARSFGTIKTGTWSKKGLDQTDPRVLAIGNPEAFDSKYIGAGYVNNNLIVQPTIINNVFRDMAFGSAGGGLTEGSETERWKLSNTLTGEFIYTGQEPFDGSISYDFTVRSTSGAQEFRFKWVVDNGDGYLDLEDPVESMVEVGSGAVSTTKTQALRVIKGDKVKPQITRNAGASTVILLYATINISQ